MATDFAIENGAFSELTICRISGGGLAVRDVAAFFDDILGPHLNVGE
jgi:hypothetical protein